MNNDLKPVWERYVGAWRVTSPAEKREIFGSCLATGCIYSDPLAVATGWEELLAYMAAFHAQIPGGHFVTEQFFVQRGRSVARWKMLNDAGVPLSEGISYAEYDPQGRLMTITGFFDPPGSAKAA